jgi:hypothetical protein
MRRSSALLVIPFLLLAGCGSGVAPVGVVAPILQVTPTVPDPPPVSLVRSCGTPEFTTSDRDGGRADGGYYVDNNVWNAEEAGPQTLRGCAYDNWYVDSVQPETSSVKTYPNVHKDIAGQKGRPFDDFTVITSPFAGRGPGIGVYDVAYDVWLNGVGNRPGVSELMVWTENRRQIPSGKKLTTYTASGFTYDVWADDDGRYVAFVSRTPQYSGVVDLKAMIAWATGKGLLPPNPTVNQIGYGIEFCSTGGGKARFTLTGFSVTMS